MNNMPQMRSPWVGMQAQMSPEQMEMLQQQQMMGQPQMMLAQNEPSTLQKISQGFSDAMPVTFGTQPPAPAEPTPTPRPSLGAIFTDQVRKNKLNPRPGRK